MSYALDFQISNLDLPPTAKAVLKAIASWANDTKHQAYPTYESMADATGYVVRTCQRAVSLLIKRGLLHKQAATETDHGYSNTVRQSANLYTVILSAGTVLKQRKKYVRKCEPTTPVTLHNSVTPATTEDRPNPSVVLKTLKTLNTLYKADVDNVTDTVIKPSLAEQGELPDITPDTVHDRSTAALEQGFNTFYNAGLKKVDRTGALKLFKRLCKLGDESYQVVGDRLAMDVSQRLNSNHNYFSNMFATHYLKNERYNDDLLSKPNRATNKDNQLNAALRDMGISKLTVGTQPKPAPVELGYGVVYDHE